MREPTKSRVRAIAIDDWADSLDACRYELAPADAKPIEPNGQDASVTGAGGLGAKDEVPKTPGHETPPYSPHRLQDMWMGAQDDGRPCVERGSGESLLAVIR